MEGESILVDVTVFFPTPPPTLLFESVERETETVYLFHGMYHPSRLRDSTLIRLSISCYFRGPKKSMSGHGSSLIFPMNSLSLFISCSQFLKNTIWYLKKKIEESGFVGTLLFFSFYFFYKRALLLKNKNPQT